MKGFGEKAETLQNYMNVERNQLVLEDIMKINQFQSFVIKGTKAFYARNVQMSMKSNIKDLALQIVENVLN